MILIVLKNYSSNIPPAGLKILPDEYRDRFDSWWHHSNRKPRNDFRGFYFSHMIACCYIIHSPELDRFYIGSTILEPEIRLDRHLEKYYGSSKFTSRANDWKIFLVIDCNSLVQARKIEAHIKRMKSKTYIRNLKNDPDRVEKLFLKYPSSRTENPSR